MGADEVWVAKMRNHAQLLHHIHHVDLLDLSLILRARKRMASSSVRGGRLWKCGNVPH